MTPTRPPASLVLMSVRLLEPPGGVSVIEKEFASAVRHLAGDDGPSLLLADMSLVRATTFEVRA